MIVGERVYWRAMYGVLIGGTILEIDPRQESPLLGSIPYLVQPDGECMGRPYFPHWTAGAGFIRLAKLEEMLK